LYYHDIALEKAVPTSLLHLDRGQFIIRVEAQNFLNHNNIGAFGYAATDVYYAYSSGTFLNVNNAREANNRAVRIWAKFTF